MNITDKGLEEIEKAADRHHDSAVLLICQVLRELRELTLWSHRGKHP